MWGSAHETFLMTQDIMSSLLCQEKNYNRFFKSNNHAIVNLLIISGFKEEIGEEAVLILQQGVIEKTASPVRAVL